VAGDASPMACIVGCQPIDRCERSSPRRSTRIFHRDPHLNNFDMKSVCCTLLLLVAFSGATTAFSQTRPSDPTTTGVEQRARAVDAARAFAPGEGDPKPPARAKADPATRAAASEARQQTGRQAARTFVPGEGDPKPVPATRQPRAERAAERKANRDRIANLNKAGQLPSYGDNYGGK